MEVLLSCFFTACLVLHTYVDYKRQILPDEVNAALALGGAFYTYFFGDVWSALQGALLATVVMLAIYWASRGGMGLGDVKLGCVLGLWLGAEQIWLCLLLAFISGGVIGILLLVCGIKTRKDAIPFGPFLCMSGWLSFFYGEKILLWYWNLW